MEARGKVPLEIGTDDDDDDDEAVKEEVTETIEKFVQKRHVQTLKYLRHVIDENRHLRLHIDHLKRRQNDPNPSPGIVDPIDPEDPPLTEISLDETPEPIEPVRPPPVAFHTTATNTDVDEFQDRCRTLTDELNNLRKEQNLQRDEFRSELAKVDDENQRLNDELKAMQRQLILTEKNNHEKQLEIQRTNNLLVEQKNLNENLVSKIEKLEENTRLLVKSINRADVKTLEMQNELEERKVFIQKLKEQISEVQLVNRTQMKQIENAEKDCQYWREKFDQQLAKSDELTEENQDLKEEVQSLDSRLKEKLVQEDKLLRERQLNNHFKDFVQIKRTLQLTQQENEQLKLEIKKLQIRLVNLTTS